MLWALAAIFFLLWLVGMVTSYTLGGFLHILLIIAVGMLLIQFTANRRMV
jgi:hypothetical protein